MSYIPQFLRVDPRDSKPVVEEVRKYLQTEIRVPIQKRLDYRAPYREACMNGFDHPMEIETHQYKLFTVAQDDINADAFIQASEIRGRYWSDLEMEFFQSVLKRPEVEWAIDNSFDGVYIAKADDPSTLSSIYKFAVYLKEEHITFWKLKYHGRGSRT
jgi:hypothetical protein